MKKEDATDREFDRIDREIRSLLWVDPADGFYDRLRARIGREAERRAWNLGGWVFVAAGVVAVIVAAVLMVEHQSRDIPTGKRRIEAAATAFPPAVAPSMIEPAPHKSVSQHRRMSKAAKAAPQLTIAENEASALRRLLSGAVVELPGRFEPKLLEFKTAEAVIEPLLPPEPVTIEPIAPPEPAVADIGGL
jgi:hypothetical protein